MFLYPAAKDLMPGWEKSATQIAAHLRTLAKPGTRDHDAMTLLAMVAGSERVAGE